MNAYSLPPHIRLHELRRDAKGLLECALDGDVPCLERFYELGKEPSLTAAQLLIARDYGFSSWAKLKQQVERNETDPRSEIIRQLIRRRNRAPKPELAAVIPYERVVATAPGTRVVLSSVRVFSDRCQIDLESKTESDVGPDALRVTGVRFADGRSTGGETDWVAQAMANPGLDPPMLDAGISFGGYRLTVSPLPPPGDLHLTIAWPRAGIPDGTSVVVDATQIAAAVGRIRPFTLGSASADAPPDSADEPASTPDSPSRGLRPLFGDLSEDRISAVVPVGEVVARSSQMAVAIHAIRVHQRWCLVEIEWIVPWMAGRSTPRAMAIFDMFQALGPYIDGRLLSPRFGIEFSDGRAIEDSWGQRKWVGGAPSDHAPAPALLTRNGGDSDLRRGRYTSGEVELMLAPLPPPGEVRFWFAWPELGVPETTTILDGTAINRAAQRLIEWPGGTAGK